MERCDRVWRWLLAVGLVSVAACRDDARGGQLRPSVLVIAPDQTDTIGNELVETTETYLGSIGGRPVQVLRVADERVDTLADVERLAARERAGLVVVLEADRLASDMVGPQQMGTLGEHGFWLGTHEVGQWRNGLDDQPGATVVLAAGNGRLPRQYATYELLRRLGARFFHPEQEHVPRHDPADLRDLARRPTLLHRGGPAYLPDFAWRSWSFHGAHPLEHLEAFSDPSHPIAEAVRVNEWIAKGFGNRFRGAGRGVVSEEQRAVRAAELEEVRDHMGFPRGTGISLHNLQQGASAEIDPDSEVPVREQIEALVADKLAAMPDARWFGIHFGPTEFTTTPDEQTVQWIDWAGQAALRLRPDIRVEINSHVTGSQPSPHFDDLGCGSGTNDEGRIDYYDLPHHTDPRLGIQVHTVMFYPLEGPARVYEQQTFEHKRCLMERASAQGRTIQWFPEGSWWLGFDNSVPMYLPLYLWSRARDIELLRPLLASRGGGTLDAHRMFDSGHEWGYWQQDYLAGLLAWNADATLGQVLGEVFDPLCEPATWREGCEAKREAIAVLEEIIDHQRELFLQREDWQGRPGGIYAYFAGEEEGDELAAAAGLEFRPVRVPFAEVLRWDEAELTHFRQTDLAALRQASLAYDGWRARLDALRPRVPEAGVPWLDEVIDGVEIDGLRAAQAANLYEAVVRYREVSLEGTNSPAVSAYPFSLAALEVLAQAQRVIARREQGYRYPAAQTHGGGVTEATAIANGTTYPYRVHTKTHLLTYWLNRQAQVTQLIVGGGLDEGPALRLSEALDRSGASLQVDWPDLEGLGGQLMVGEHVLEPPAEALALGDAPGYWPVSAELTTSGPPLSLSGGVVRSDVLATTAAGGMALLYPDDPATEGVLAGVLPSLRWAWVPQPAALVLAPDGDADGSVSFDAVVHAAVVQGDGASGFSTAPVELALPVAVGADGMPLSITVAEAVLSGRVEAGAIVSPITLDGQLSVDDIVKAAVELAGFDEEGTLVLLAGVWGFDPADPPQWVPIVAELTVE